MMQTLVVFLSLASQGLTIEAVIARAEAYVRGFQNDLSGIVAEEVYTQDYRNISPARSNRPPSSHRELKSDLLMVKPQGSHRWLQFRDVFEVDRKPIRDRSERLMDLFVNPTASTRSQVDRIVQESARFNIGAIERNINVPVLALTILLREHSGRFRFTRTDKTVGTLIDSIDATGLWVIEFKESRTNTIIRGNGGADVPASGRLWIDPNTGRVLMTELRLDPGGIRATIDVRYEPARAGPLASIMLPAEMRESYEESGSRIVGTAVYGRFRQFQVQVDEQIAPVKK